MDKFELIDAIRELNSTASVEFLSQFDEKQLQRYIQNLRDLNAAELTAAVAGN